MSAYRLVLVRHGESQWNQDNRFTGWVDVDLSEKGRAEAKKAGKTAVKDAKTAGKVAKVVAPLVVLKPYADSGTSESAHESLGRDWRDSGTESS